MKVYIITFFIFLNINLFGFENIKLKIIDNDKCFIEYHENTGNLIEKNIKNNCPKLDKIYKIFKKKHKIDKKIIKNNSNVFLENEKKIRKYYKNIKSFTYFQIKDNSIKLFYKLPINTKIKVNNKKYLFKNIFLNKQKNKYFIVLDKYNKKIYKQTKINLKDFNKILKTISKEDIIKK
jgi:hypothetical protein